MIKSHSYCLSLVEECIPGKGKLIDVGSGNGYLIKIAKDRGWKTTGQEIDCTHAKVLSKKTGINILCGEFSDIEIDEKFDAVTMLHVLEHLKQPEKHIKKVNYVLNANGIVFIALPNIQSLSSLFKLFLEKMKLKKKNVAAYYDTGHHLWYFSPFTIRRFLERNGFEILRIYSGDNINLDRSALLNYIDEKILSKLLWHSSMGVIARKK
jgi:2-polyprenyl-3-methyl-5-hydroxy-6-metoxy-1,4-benzoquinol methylase